MKIAILGATSQIAKDLIISFSRHSDDQCILFSRVPVNVSAWLKEYHIQSYSSHSYDEFSHGDYDAIINFVGVGDPSRAKKMGASIFDITYDYDQLALTYIKQHPECKYIFLSSGAVYGDVFEKPVHSESVAQFPVNYLGETHWYAIAKLYAEARHRALPNLPIVDVRVFNYFSHTQDMSARFFITDMLRAIRDHEVFETTSENIVRDFLHPDDFYQLIACILKAEPVNMAVDCYSKAPVDKMTLLEVMQKEFHLEYQVTDSDISVNATGRKLNYYSSHLLAKKLGYFPVYTSESCILTEISNYLAAV